MLVQDPLSGYLHEVPDALAYYGDYGDCGYGYYDGYDEYMDPSMAEYLGESGYFGLFPGLISKIVGAVTGGGGSPPPPLPFPPLPFLNQPAGAGFAPFPGIRAYIESVVRDVLKETQPAPNQMLPQAGMSYRRRRRR